MHPLLHRILSGAVTADGESFAVVVRQVDGARTAELFTGPTRRVPSLADLPVAPDGPPVLAVVPHRQIAERGFEAVDDGTPLLALSVTARAAVPVAELLAALPEGPGAFRETGYDVCDEDYEATVRAVLDDEIAAGAGSNFVVHRALTGRLERPPAHAALGLLRRLLVGEQHAYWTFALHTPEISLAGATPECHVSLDAGVVTMNPISGTLRHPAGGYPSERAREDAYLSFLHDEKERDELAMVVDEELKMMAVVGDRGGRVRGPYLKEMAHLAHTEYVLEGRTSLDVRDVLRATLFAPTVVGSPLRNACRVIARHERRGRGYYGGVLALIDHDADGRQRLDAPILIRTAHLHPDGTVRVPAGATLVRGSVPAHELAETRAKAAAVLAALGVGADVHDRAGVHDRGGRVVYEELSHPSRDHAIPHGPRIAEVLAGRNERLARFWLQEHPRAAASGMRVDVVEAEDEFTAMFAHVLTSLGHEVRLVPWQRARGVAHREGVVVLGPGPGDPNDRSDPRIDALHVLAKARLAAGRPVLGICLGHQVLASALGLRVDRLPVPGQGMQSRVDLFGRPERVGFYNSFAAVAAPLEGTQVGADDAGRVVALRGPGHLGLQFHPESVLTVHGRTILAESMAHLTASQA